MNRRSVYFWKESIFYRPSVSTPLEKVHIKHTVYIHNIYEPYFLASKHKYPSPPRPPGRRAGTDGRMYAHSGPCGQAVDSSQFQQSLIVFSMFRDFVILVHGNCRYGHFEISHALSKFKIWTSSATLFFKRIYMENMGPMFHQKGYICGSYVPYISGTKSIFALTDHICLVEGPFTDRESVHFWKSLHTWTLSPSILAQVMKRGILVLINGVCLSTGDIGY